MEKKLRVLYLDLYLDYIAPTRNLLPFLLKKVFDVTFYGPGYVSDELLELGVEKFIENKGKFDFIITNEHIFFNAQKNISESIFVNIYKKNYVLNFNANLIFSSINNMFIFFKTTNIDKLLIILETDYYCLDNKIIDSIYSSNANVVTEGKQFIKSVSELENLKYEKFGRKANDYWYDFVNKYDDKILSLSQFVGESEFSFIHFLNKKNLVDIPGVNYYSRKEALKNIESNNIKLQSKNYMKLYSLYSKLGGKPFSKYSLLKLYNNLFRVNIEKSRYAFTCGSALDIPIRKFYEIPALGTLLLCVPCKGFNELGFEDGRNCRAIKPSNLYEAIMELEGNSSLAESIASNGRNLVWKSHTASSRALQILMGCNAIKNRKFKGSSWINGEFNLK